MQEFERRELVEIAVEAVQEGGRLIREAFARPRGGEVQKGAIDLVTETDGAVEALLRQRLVARTGFAFLGEEEGASGAVQEGGYVWIVDPIDGTTNFAHRVPYLATSVGLWGPEGAIVGVIYNPVFDELFVSDGRTARLGDAALPQLAYQPLERSLLVTGFPYDRQTNPDNNVMECHALLMRTRGVRRLGAAALDMAWLAAGRFDGFWEPTLQPWDVVAGLALLSAVGGVATNYSGDPWTLEHRTLIAGHPQRVAELRSILAELRQGSGLPLDLPDRDKVQR